MVKGKTWPGNWRKISCPGTTLDSAGSPSERTVAVQGQGNLCSDSFFHWVISPPAQLPEPTSLSFCLTTSGWESIEREMRSAEDDFLVTSHPTPPPIDFFSCSAVSYDDWWAQWVGVGTNEIITESPPPWVLVSLAHSKHIHDSLSYKCMLLFGQRELRKSHP